MNQTYYDEKIKTLPENLQYAIMMSDWEKTLIEIQNKFKLHIDQTQVLEDSTIKLMFGDIDASDFINIMFNDGHVNSTLAADILLDIDLKILKKVRQTLIDIEEKEKEDEELEELLMDEDERNEKKELEIYGNYYKEVAKILDETEQEILKEGILPDGSNITDEMLGITTEIPEDVDKTKDELLQEINTPTKSFSEKTLIQIPKIDIYKENENKVLDTNVSDKIEIIPVDHQIENIHLEKPYKNTEMKEVIKTEINKNLSTISTQDISKTKEEKPNIINIKRPVDINLNDIYREPIE